MTTATAPETTTGLAALLADADRLHEQVVSWRRHLHAHPEPSFHEHETAQYVVNVLADLDGLELARPTPTSVVARLRGARAGRTIAVRADMDALPITEETGLPFASTSTGVMHACGHDGHTATLLGLATLLSRHRAQLAGEVRFVFQHAEELAPGGAESLVEAGVMDGVDEVLGVHLWSQLETGRIALIEGPAMAAPDSFDCTITGRGGHAAAPHETVDPIAIAAQVVTAWQQVVSRTVDPLDPAVVSVTQFHAGTAYNVIPDTAHLAGTVRTFDAALRTRIPQQLAAIARAIAESFGGSAEFTLDPGYRPVLNDPALTGRLREVTAAAFGEEVLAPMRPTMGGEDFSAYQQRAPGTFAFVGAGNAARGITYPHHHAKFDIDERAMGLALRWFAVAVHDRLS